MRMIARIMVFVLLVLAVGLAGGSQHTTQAAQNAHSALQANTSANTFSVAAGAAQDDCTPSHLAASVSGAAQERGECGPSPFAAAGVICFGACPVLEAVPSADASTDADTVLEKFDPAPVAVLSGSGSAPEPHPPK